MVQIENLKRALEELRTIVERRIDGVNKDVFVRIANNHKSFTEHLCAVPVKELAKSGRKDDYDWDAIESVQNLESNARSLGKDIDNIMLSWRCDLEHIERSISTILEEVEK